MDITGARKPEWLAETWATRCANGTAARTETEEREELFAALDLIIGDAEAATGGNLAAARQSLIDGVEAARNR